MKTYCFLAPLFLIILTGCGSHGLATVPVHGCVTLDGGEWPANGMILFTAAEPVVGLPLRPGRAMFDRQGNFTVATFGEDDGLIPGTYKVLVICGEEIGNIENALAKSYVPQRYQNPVTSGLELKVPLGSGPIEVSYDLTKED